MSGQRDRPIHPLDAVHEWERSTLPARQLLQVIRAARELHGAAWEDHVGGEVWLTDDPIDLVIAIAERLERSALALARGVRSWSYEARR